MAQSIAIVFFGIALMVAVYGLWSPTYRSEIFTGSMILLLMGNLIAIVRVGNLLEERFKRR